MPDTAQPLIDIVEQAYRVFAGPKPPTTGVCERCCMTAAIEADFFNPDIHELPFSYINDWFCAACACDGIPMSTWSYLLPRILDMLAVGEEPSMTGLAVTLSRFDSGNPQNWTSEQWSVLDAFQRSYLRWYIENGPDFLDEAVCMFRRGGWPLEGLLEQLLSVPDDVLAARLWRDWCNDGWHGAIWVTAFWEGKENGQMFEFYTSVELHNRMTALALSDHAAKDLAAKASDIVSVIEANADWLR